MSSPLNALNTLQRSHSLPGGRSLPASPAGRTPRAEKTAFLPNLDVVLNGNVLDANRIEQRLGDKRLNFLASVHPKIMGRKIYANLLWQEKARCMVSLHACNFLPAVGHTRKCGDFTLKTVSETPVGKGLGYLRHGEIVCRGETRPFSSLQCKTWNDGGTLRPAALRKLLAAVRPFDDEPIAVHCAAGLGRTGTFVASSFAQHLRQKHPEASPESLADKAVWMVRMHRPGSVENDGQYANVVAMAASNAPATSRSADTLQSVTDDKDGAAKPLPASVTAPTVANALPSPRRDGRTGPWIAPTPEGKANLGQLTNRVARWLLAPIDFLGFGGGTSLLRREVPLLSHLYREGVLRSVLVGIGEFAYHFGYLAGLTVGALLDHTSQPSSEEDDEPEPIAAACATIGARLCSLPFTSLAHLGTYLTAPLKAAAFLAGNAARSAEPTV